MCTGSERCALPATAGRTPEVHQGEYRISRRQTCLPRHARWWSVALAEHRSVIVQVAGSTSSGTTSLMYY